MLKELLLQKGMSEADADEVVKASAEQTDDSSLEALQKALNSDKSESLFKAEGGKGKGAPESDDDDEDGAGEEYDEKFMKKHKKYMKSIGKEKGGHNDDEPDGDENMFGKEMKKAVDNIDPNAEGAIVEMAELAPVLDALVSVMGNMAKAISGLKSDIKIISAQNSETYGLMAKAAAVQVESAEIISGIANQPAGRRGALVQDMKKAVSVASPKGNVWAVLAKAVNAGDMKAGQIGSKYESSGKRFDFLNPEEQAYVNELIAKEAN